MSRAERSWQPSNDLPGTVGGPSTLSMPDDWTLSTPWQRARRERRRRRYRRRRAYRSLSDGDDYHRVRGRQEPTLVAEATVGPTTATGGEPTSLRCGGSGSVGRSSWPTSTPAASTQRHQQAPPRRRPDRLRSGSTRQVVPTSTVTSVASVYGSSPATPTGRSCAETPSDSGLYMRYAWTANTNVKPAFNHVV